MRIGFDVDGVLADFNTGFIKRVIHVTGVDLFPPRPFDIPMWDYPQHYGYTEAQVNAVWENIKADATFWRRLPEYPGTESFLFGTIESLDREGNDVYFITSRPGIAAKKQTENWIRAAGLNWMEPTVLISSAKGLCAHALRLDIYVDDRWENCLDVVATSEGTKVYLLDQPWNQERSHPAIERISSLQEMNHLA